MKINFSLVLLGAVAGFAVTSAISWTWLHNLPRQIVIKRVYDSTTSILRSQHLIFGAPRAIDDRYNIDSTAGISILVREGFVIGHADRFKAPLWVSQHWTREYRQASDAQRDTKRDFQIDTELPEYARGSSRYNNGAYQRGHMSRNKDNLAFGSDNTQMGDRMSNIVPQRPNLNERVWARLEDVAHNSVERDGIEEVWVISGSVFTNMKPIELVGNGIGVPECTYKIIAWIDSKGNFEMQGFVLPQSASDTNLENYLVTVRSIEKRTGLDFFPELSLDQSEKLESFLPKALWDTP